MFVLFQAFRSGKKPKRFDYYEHLFSDISTIFITKHECTDSIHINIWHVYFSKKIHKFLYILHNNYAVCIRFVDFSIILR